MKRRVDRLFVRMHPRIYKARRVVTLDPSQPEIWDAGLAVHNERIVALGPWIELKDHGPSFDLGPATLVPALINAHTHLELSHLVGKIPPGLGFMAWADQLFALLRTADQAPSKRANVNFACPGVAYVVDVRSKPTPLGSPQQHVCTAVRTLREYAGRNRAICPELEQGREVWSFAAHALYSTHAEFAVQLKFMAEQHGRVFSIHLSEVPGENQLFLSGQGDFAAFLRARRVLPKGFDAPGLSAVAYADALGILNVRTVAVHCVHVSDADIEILARSGARVCLCPRSNAWIGVGQAPVAALWTAGIPLCLGTDSLASNADLDMWSELRALRDFLPDISLTELLTMASRNPAAALGLDDQCGCLKLGMPARWAVAPEDFANLPA